MTDQERRDRIDLLNQEVAHLAAGDPPRWDVSPTEFADQEVEKLIGEEHD